jgi:heavy metal sensor kinase
MRSIRLSLLVYFLGLLVVALGVASWLVYRSAQQTLAEKEAAMRARIQSEYEKQALHARERLDKGLLDEAMALRSRVRIEIDWQHIDARDQGFNRSLHSLGAGLAASGPSGYLTTAPWLLQMHNFSPPPRQGVGRAPRTWPVLPPFAFEIWRCTLVDLKLNQPELVTPQRERIGQYFQRIGQYFQIDINLGIDSWGKPIHSPSLGERFFPTPEGFGEGSLLHFETDDFEWAPGEWLRRVRLKVAGTEREFIRPPRPDSRGSEGSPPPPPMPRVESRRGRPRPAARDYIVVQVAADKKNLANTLATLDGECDEKIAALKAETATALSRLRTHLLAISSLTFAATVLGTWVLVRAGLRPLRRMTDAVSKVSPRDFRLPLGDEVLPHELRPIAERLTAALDQLKRAFAREKQATADISHELRTPLAALLTTVELALRKQRSAEQYREMLEEAHSSAKQMNQIVERLLTLARIDAGVDRVRAQPVDVTVLAAQCAAVVRPLAEARGLHLSVSGCSEGFDEREHCSARLTTDPDKLREVLNNLLYNAIQYNRPEGRIDLRVDRANGHVRLEVRDTGIGIPHEARDLIFERFYRADPSRNGDGMNAGLGLAIVKEYVDLLGGHISVESEPGQGSTFRVELPASPSVLA